MTDEQLDQKMADFFRALADSMPEPEPETPEQAKQRRKEARAAQRKSDRLWAKACADIDPDDLKMQEITWVVDGIEHAIEDNEDMIDVHLGRLFDVYGYGLKYKIRTLK